MLSRNFPALSHLFQEYQRHVIVPLKHCSMSKDSRRWYAAATQLSRAPFCGGVLLKVLRKQLSREDLGMFVPQTSSRIIQFWPSGTVFLYTKGSVFDNVWHPGKDSGKLQVDSGLSMVRRAFHTDYSLKNTGVVFQWFEDEKKLATGRCLKIPFGATAGTSSKSVAVALRSFQHLKSQIWRRKIAVECCWFDPSSKNHRIIEVENCFLLQSDHFPLHLELDDVSTDCHFFERAKACDEFLESATDIYRYLQQELMAADHIGRSPCSPFKMTKSWCQDEENQDEYSRKIEKYHQNQSKSNTCPKWSILNANSSECGRPSWGSFFRGNLENIAGSTLNDGGWSGSIGSACLWPRIYGPLFARLMVILNLGASNLDVRIARSIGFPPRREALVSINGTLNSGVGFMKFWMLDGRPTFWHCSRLGQKIHSQRSWRTIA